MPFHVYIIQSVKDGSYYVGSTQNLEKRIERHNQGHLKYTNLNRPWNLVYQKNFPDRSSAVKRENEIKGFGNPVLIEILVRTSRLSTGKVTSPRFAAHAR